METSIECNTVEGKYILIFKRGHDSLSLRFSDKENRKTIYYGSIGFRELRNYLLNRKKEYKNIFGAENNILLDKTKII